jgi:hypothetical protein
MNGGAPDAGIRLELRWRGERNPEEGAEKMMNRIGAALIGLSLAVSTALPAPLAMAAPAAQRGPAIEAGEVIQVGHRSHKRYWRDGNRRHDRWRDRGHDRRDFRYGHRYDRHAWRRDRHRDHGHRHGHRHHHDAAPYIFGGIALGTLLLLHSYERDRH